MLSWLRFVLLSTLHVCTATFYVIPSLLTPLLLLQLLLLLPSFLSLSAAAAAATAAGCGFPNLIRFLLWPDQKTEIPCSLLPSCTDAYPLPLPLPLPLPNNIINLIDAAVVLFSLRRFHLNPIPSPKSNRERSGSGPHTSTRTCVPCFLRGLT